MMKIESLQAKQQRDTLDAFMATIELYEDVGKEIPGNIIYPNESAISTKQVTNIMSIKKMRCMFVSPISCTSSMSLTYQF